MAEDRDEDRQDGFLGRWSKRKREIAARGKIAENRETANSGDESQGTAATPVHDEEKRAREELEAANRAAAEAVDLESLDYESNFSLFLKAGVPAALRRQAMRKLWTSNPVLANLDGLNDYDQDFADPSLNVFQSIWQAGRGYLSSEELEKPPLKESVGKVDTDADTKAELSNSGGAELEIEKQKAPGETDPESNGETEPVEEARGARVSIRTRLKG
jgi:Protein of unknown function (DUF3306)